MALNIKPFKLRLADDRLLENAGQLQEFVMDLHDKIPAINSPEYQAGKDRYNKFAKFYNQNVQDVWEIYK